MSQVPGSSPSRPDRSARAAAAPVCGKATAERRRPAIRAAVLDADTDEILNRADIRESAAI